MKYLDEIPTFPAAGLTHQISQGFGPVQLTGSRSSTPLCNSFQDFLY